VYWYNLPNLPGRPEVGKPTTNTLGKEAFITFEDQMNWYIAYGEYTWGWFGILVAGIGGYFLWATLQQGKSQAEDFRNKDDLKTYLTAIDMLKLELGELNKVSALALFQRNEFLNKIKENNLETDSFLSKVSRLYNIKELMFSGSKDYNLRVDLDFMTDSLFFFTQDFDKNDPDNMTRAENRVIEEMHHRALSSIHLGHSLYKEIIKIVEVYKSYLEMVKNTKELSKVTLYLLSQSPIDNKSLRFIIEKLFHEGSAININLTKNKIYRSDLEDLDLELVNILGYKYGNDLSFANEPRNP